ncbi:hypothetical protein CBER1_03126 [Cercospora berteroae]|uniref:Nucleoporin NDC1 n=1 Tax=Cercospora berteroae TaxID=357750 RepID=A0A2S6CK31_9PEZI|nr:hypothetical protein CBER1_03126 [Cercospora berteroae]
MATTLTLTMADKGRSNLFAAPPAPVVQQGRVKAYKDFLTPSFHRRFCSAAGLALLVCLADSWWLSNSRHFLWSWFPLGPAGIRATLLFLPCLMVFIVRLANMHLGARTSASSAQAVYEMVGTKGLAKTLSIVFWYWTSAFMFGEIYIWTRSSDAELSLVDVGREWERPQLNENSIALRCLFVSLAISQTFLHIWRDYDQVRIGDGTKQQVYDVAALKEVLGPNAKWLPEALLQMVARTRTIVSRSFNLTIVAVCILPIPLYYGLLRRIAWNLTFSFARIFYSQLQSDDRPTGLSHLGRLTRQASFSSFMLVSLWEVSNAAFDIFTAQPPLRKGQALTSEIKDARGVVLHKSKDPNGSLLTGLKSKRETNKSFALWELHLITTQFENRRKTIYTEVDRAGGSTWSQVCNLCLGEISAVQQRIEEELAPAEYKKKLQANKIHEVQPPVMPRPEDDTAMKRIADRQVIQDGMLETRQKPDFYNTVGNLARSIGQQPGAQNPILPRAQRAIEWSRDQVVPQEYQERLRPQELEKQASGKLIELLETPLGIPFRQTFAKRVNSVVFGAPISQQTNITHAAQSLSQLAVLSLKEDDFGLAQKDIATIMRTFTSVITTIEKFVKELAPHWTDVEFLDARDRNVKEVDELLDVLKKGLEEILLAFGEYAETLQLSRKEVREAREAITKASKQPVPEIEQVRTTTDPPRPQEQPRDQRRVEQRPEMRERRRQQQR